MTRLGHGAPQARLWGQLAGVVLLAAALSGAVVAAIPVSAARPSGSGANVVFVRMDGTTKGNWHGIYGSDGALVIGDVAALPPYAQVTATGQSAWTWSPATSDVRGLQRVSAAGRLAACWYGSSFAIDVNLTDGQPHQVAIYNVDWDSVTRSLRVDVRDALTGGLLDTRAMNSYSGGQYLVWQVTGRVTFQFTSAGGYNAVVSGLFFDGTSGTVIPNVAPTVSLTAPTNNSVSTVSTPVTVSATANDTDGTIAQIEFFVNGASIGVDPSSPYSTTWTPAATGVYALTAVTTDNAGATASAGPITVTVTAGLPLTLRKVSGFDHPVHATGAGDGSGRLFVLELTGKIWIVQGDAVLPTPFMDLTSKLDCGDGRKRLLSIAFPPGHAATHRFYVKYLDKSCNITIARYTTTSDPNIGDLSSEQIVLSQPVGDGLFGGPIYFGPGGYLYASLGDGSHSDTDPGDNGRDLSKILGKMIRIDVETGTPLTYTIPPGNPFVGTPGARPEIWASGFRNPWRFTFDRLTGDLYIGDVGSLSWEEVDFQPAGSAGGQNYGWKTLEGNHCYAASSCNAAGMTPPIFEYDHTVGCSVTGGVVYRGSRIPSMQGLYLFSDFCSGRVSGLKQVGSAWQQTLITTTEHGSGPDYAKGLAVVAFAEDDDGNVFLLDYEHVHTGGSVDGGGLYVFEPGGSPVTPTVSTPTISPAGGPFSAPVNVTLSSSTAGAAIRYTTDGSSPSATSALYASPFAVSVTTTVKARAFAAGLLDSAVASATFTIVVPTVATPTINPAGGSFTAPLNVTLSSSTSGAVIRFTTDGSAPTSASTLYGAPIAVSATTTIKARAFAGGMVDSAVASATFTITPPPVGGPTSVTFVRADTTTQGTWRGPYGNDGALLVGDATALPSYAQVAASGQSGWTWSPATADLRGLQRVTAPGRFAAGWYGGAFNLDVTITDGQAHQFAIYCVDWDTTDRGQRVDVRDAASGALLDTRTLSGFNGGQYLVWQLRGHVVILLTRTSGYNAVVSAVFFDSSSVAPTVTPTISPAGGAFSAPVNVTLASATPGATIRYTLDDSTPTNSSPIYGGPVAVTTSATLRARASAPGMVDSAVAVASFTISTAPPSGGGTTATFVRLDTTTQGTWRGVYGADGALVVGDATALPGYAQVTPAGHTGWNWSPDSTDLRGLQRVASASRLAAAWYGATFTLDVAVNDGQTHQMAIYFLDWDTNARAERVEVRDAVTGALLDSRTLSGFNGGQYLIWQLRGHVVITLTRTSGDNAVVSGLFFR